MVYEYADVYQYLQLCPFPSRPLILPFVLPFASSTYASLLAFRLVLCLRFDLPYVNTTLMVNGWLKCYMTLKSCCDLLTLAVFAML